MPILCYKLTSQQLHICSVIIKPHLMIAALLGLTLSSYLQDILVGSSTSAVIDSILICDGVSITSAYFDLYCISRHYYGRNVPCQQFQHGRYQRVERQRPLRARTALHPLPAQ